MSAAWSGAPEAEGRLGGVCGVGVDRGRRVQPPGDGRSQENSSPPKNARRAARAARRCDCGVGADQVERVSAVLGRATAPAVPGLSSVSVDSGLGGALLVCCNLYSCKNYDRRR